MRALLLACAAVAVVAAALAGAAALDRPVGEGARDAVPAQPDAIAGLSSAAAAGLPPLGLVLDRPPPGGIGQLPVETQLDRLRALATPAAPARRHVELGSVLQAFGRHEEAADAYRTALAREPGDLAARIGLVMVAAADGDPDALAEAERAMAALARANPDAQIVAFNRAWLAIYRSDPDGARAGLERTVALGADTPLGVTADSLLGALRGGAGAAGP